MYMYSLYTRDTYCLVGSCTAMTLTVHAQEWPHAMQAVKGIVEGCRQSNCILLGGEVSSLCREPVVQLHIMLISGFSPCEA